MTTHSDFLIGRIALERGILSVDQLAECLNDQRGATSSSLSDIMLRKGLIKQNDLDSLLAEQKQRLAEALDLSDPKLEDALLGRLLIKQGLVKEAQLYECLRAQAEVGEAGQKAPRLGELLARKGFLTTDATDRVFTPPRKETLRCTKCGAQFSASGIEAGKKYSCKQCGAVLERQERERKLGETTEAVRVDMPEDAAQVAKDPARQFAAGKYLLIQEVGRGGMGVVWKAWQKDLKRYVAIKILVGTMWTDAEIKRFYREAQMAASLSHPNIASIYEVGSHEGKHFIAMEFVDGDSLARIMAPPVGKGTARAIKHLPPRRAIEIVREAALAADYAHSKKIIHRDLKPHNIMVQKSDNRVYVMDFGLAKPLRSKDSITVSDAIVGTPQYMSPEQARGDAVDRRTDVFSLGAVLYSALTGKPPFDGRSPAEIMMAVLADDPTSMRRLNPRIHADVETICQKAMDKDRHRRYDSAQSLADDLGKYLEGEPIAARPLSARERLWKEAKRRPILAVLIAAGFAAAVLISLILGGMALSTQQRVNQLLETARASAIRGLWDEAMANYLKVLALDENNPEALSGLQLASENTQKTRAEIEDQLQKRTKSIANHRRDGDLFYRANNWQRALLEYQAIVDAIPDADPEVKNRIEKCRQALDKEQQQSGKDKDVIAKFIQARAAQEEKARQERMAKINAFADYHRAEEAIEQAARMRLSDDGFSVSDVREKYMESRESLRRAIEKDPSYAEAIYRRGQVKHKMGEYDMAELDFKNALEFSSDSGPAAFGAAMTQLALYMLHTYVPHVVDPEARQAALGKMRAWCLRAENSQNPFERWCAKALQTLQTNPKDALEKIQTVAREGKANFFYYYVLACIQLESGDVRAAHNSLKAALDLEPIAAEARFLYAVTKMKTDDLTGAETQARMAIEATPQNTSITYLAHVLLAAILHEQNQLQPALDELGKASVSYRLMREPIDALARRWLKASRGEK
jgi:serine/threonine protein kinase/Tfp pilus assembly protein PilF